MIKQIKIYEWLLNKNNMSQRNECIRSIEKAYQLAPLSGFFDGCDMNYSYNTIGINKAYTSNLMDIQFFPVFSIFDIFLKYDGHKIEDYTQYIIECKDINSETSILFRKKYSRCYGYKLNRISNFNYNVLYYRRPSKLNKSYSNGHINDLYDTELCIEKKKIIANENVGLIEKKITQKVLLKFIKH